jgi:hypothetical protein
LRCFKIIAFDEKFDRCFGSGFFVGQTSFRIFDEALLRRTPQGHSFNEHLSEWLLAKNYKCLELWRDEVIFELVANIHETKSLTQQLK